MNKSTVSFLRRLTVFAGAAACVLAQGSGCGTQLFVTDAGGNGQNGVMFDLVNISNAPITICGFDVNLDPGTFPAQTWFVTGGGSHQAVTTNPAAWTLASTGPVTSLGTSVTGPGNVLTPFPAINVTIPPGVTQGFAVSIGTTLVPLNYTSGTAAQGVGTVFASDPNLQFIVGYGAAYSGTAAGPFGGTFGSVTTGGRIANIRVGYTFQPNPASWQVNSPASSFDVNGVSATDPLGFTYATAHGYGCGENQAHFSSTNPGLPWELGMGLAPPVPAASGGLVTTGGQKFNLEVADPTLTYLNGLTFTTPFAGGTIAFVAPVGFAFSAQMDNVNPASPEGFTLSAVVRFEVLPSPMTIPGPAGDDNAITLTLGTPPNCLPLIPFYGVQQTAMHVSTNGRVQLGGVANPTYTPSVATAQAEGMVGCWADFDTATNAPAGTITVDASLPGIISVNYVNVGYFGQVGTFNTFQIVFDTTTGNITLANLSGLLAQLAGSTLNMFTGISRGNSATDPGMANFLPSGSGSGANGSDMLYNLGVAPSNGGCANIFFVPNANNNYNWTAN